jgi:hypothetical protein
VRAALAATAELRAVGAALQPRTVAAVVDAIAANPGPAAHAGLAQLFDDARPRGFGRDRGPGGGHAAAGLTQSEIVAVCRDYAPGGLPDAQRGTEIGLAVAFLTVVGSAVSAEVIEPLVLHHAATEATTVLMAVAGGLMFDRFASAGVVWNKLTGGMDRLLSDDPVREARVDAACFLVAYLLGLPFAPFRPDVQEVLKMHARKRPPSRRQISSPGQNASPSKELSVDPRMGSTKLPSLDDDLVDLYLIWLLAGAAAESMTDGMLVESDVGHAKALLRKATGSIDERRILTAYAMARRLLTRHQVVHAKLAENMLSGLSAGECVTLLDSEFSGST